MPNDRCPNCGGKMFIDEEDKETYCINCAYRVGLRQWQRLQQLSKNPKPASTVSFGTPDSLNVVKRRM